MAVVTDAIYDPESEAHPDWDASQDELAARAVKYGNERTREVYKRLRGVGVWAEDIEGVADLAAIPVLEKDDVPALQAARPPFGGMLSLRAGTLKRIFRSPGPINDPQGQDEDFWRVAPAAWAAGFRDGDVVLNSFSYHLTPGGLMLDAGLRKLGCTVIPGGVGNSAAQVEAACAAGATGYTGTPQFLLTLFERARDMGHELPIRRALVTGAPLPPPLRARLQDEVGVDVYQSYGTADAGTLGYECGEKNGWHVAPGIVIELLAPGDDRPAGEGETGQVVVTSPNGIYPLVRFGTGDLSAWNPEPCRCGRTSRRLVGFMGRVGEGVKVRGMFVHPRELAGALDGDPMVARYQAVVTEGAGGGDMFTVRVEAAPGCGLGDEEVAALVARIREAVKVRPVVEVVGVGEIGEEAGVVVDGRG
ncbi:MAG: phenylacetate--CoA ligase family protein [Gemmatimonadota bacterium]|nr:phenylacetate--CoA ligase family protein [Gemmatimonadota bacterium]MDE2986192.1 phenylacetate--CoA ligase family protein [Gemmatimonadota bacterium]